MTATLIIAAIPLAIVLAVIVATAIDDAKRVSTNRVLGNLDDAQEVQE